MTKLEVQLLAQIFENAKIVRTKFRHLQWSVVLLLVALVCLIAVAIALNVPIPQ